MNLVIDIGNSNTKLALFSQGRIRKLEQVENLTIAILNQIRLEHTGIKHSILSAVREVDPALIDYLESTFSCFIRLSESTPLPIVNAYRTPSTLGMDRLAAAVAANNIFPGKDVLVIDTGTALTFDLVTADNRYIGGNISPGLKMRFKSLHQFTGSLPLCVEKDDFSTLGDTTEAAIVSGVQHGMILEMDGFIDMMKALFNEPVVILTGGDSKFFDKKLKNSIFVNQNLVLIGLNEILNFNVTQ
jgi:type III pantothenate kinase